MCCTYQNFCCCRCCLLVRFNVFILNVLLNFKYTQPFYQKTINVILAKHIFFSFKKHKQNDVEHLTTNTYAIKKSAINLNIKLTTEIKKNKTKTTNDSNWNWTKLNSFKYYSNPLVFFCALCYDSKFAFLSSAHVMWHNFYRNERKLKWLFAVFSVSVCSVGLWPWSKFLQKTVYYCHTIVCRLKYFELVLSGQ